MESPRRAGSPVSWDPSEEEAAFLRTIASPPGSPGGRAASPAPARPWLAQLAAEGRPGLRFLLSRPPAAAAGHRAHLAALASPERPGLRFLLARPPSQPPPSPRQALAALAGPARPGLAFLAGRPESPRSAEQLTAPAPESPRDALAALAGPARPGLAFLHARPASPQRTGVPAHAPPEAPAPLPGAPAPPPGPAPAASPVAADPAAPAAAEAERQQKEEQQREEQRQREAQQQRERQQQQEERERREKQEREQQRLHQQQEEQREREQQEQRQRENQQRQQEQREREQQQRQERGQQELMRQQQQQREREQRELMRQQEERRNQQEARLQQKEQQDRERREQEERGRAEQAARRQPEGHEERPLPREPGEEIATQGQRGAEPRRGESASPPRRWLGELATPDRPGLRFLLARPPQPAAGAPQPGASPRPSLAALAGPARPGLAFLSARPPSAQPAGTAPAERGASFPLDRAPPQQQEGRSPPPRDARAEAQPAAPSPGQQRPWLQSLANPARPGLQFLLNRPPGPAPAARPLTPTEGVDLLPMPVRPEAAARTAAPPAASLQRRASAAAAAAAAAAAPPAEVSPAPSSRRRAGAGLVSPMPPQDPGGRGAARSGGRCGEPLDTIPIAAAVSLLERQARAAAQLREYRSPQRQRAALHRPRCSKPLGAHGVGLVLLLRSRGRRSLAHVNLLRMLLDGCARSAPAGAAHAPAWVLPPWFDLDTDPLPALSRRGAPGALLQRTAEQGAETTPPPAESVDVVPRCPAEVSPPRKQPRPAQGHTEAAPPAPQGKARAPPPELLALTRQRAADAKQRRAAEADAVRRLAQGPFGTAKPSPRGAAARIPRLLYRGAVARRRPLPGGADWERFAAAASGRRPPARPPPPGVGSFGVACSRASADRAADPPPGPGQLALALARGRMAPPPDKKQGAPPSPRARSPPRAPPAAARGPSVTPQLQLEALQSALSRALRPRTPSPAPPVPPPAPPRLSVTPVTPPPAASRPSPPPAAAPPAGGPRPSAADGDVAALAAASLQELDELTRILVQGRLRRDDLAADMAALEQQVRSRSARDASPHLGWPLDRRPGSAPMQP